MKEFGGSSMGHAAGLAILVVVGRSESPVIGRETR